MTCNKIWFVLNLGLNIAKIEIGELVNLISVVGSFELFNKILVKGAKEP